MPSIHGGLAVRPWLWLFHRLRCLLLLNIVELNHMVDTLDDAHLLGDDILEFFDVPHLLAMQDLSTRSLSQHQPIRGLVALVLAELNFLCCYFCGVPLWLLGIDGMQVDC